ncbi:BQ2448_3086 [Microbotryum intermedium]|uniref:glucan 1,3-beta-glucosidase n=1 Tax=Microbotryum intermedium TaxID=269621 RepID=A0A238FK05_9BASI|nr:BQ2448_3086 [Microbotryum intermedium]
MPSYPYGDNNNYGSVPHGSTDQFPPSASNAHLSPRGEKPYEYNYDAPVPQKRGVSKWIKFGIPLLLLVIAGAVVGGIFGSRVANDSKSRANANAAAQGGSSSASSGSGTSSQATGTSGTSSSPSRTSSSTPSATPTTVPGQYTVTNRPAWDWSQDKSIGMCLGNWLILERWMNEDWFIQVAGNSSLDEWTLSQVLGDKLPSVMQEHYNTWITESDFDIMAQSGVNLIRIPTGFWAFIPTVSGEPYYNNITELQFQLNKVLGWAYARNMYAVIDLHGLPGSQNGEQSSGHLTTSPAWFGNTVNQGRSDATVTAVTDFIEASAFRSILAGIEVINEPRPYTEAQNQELMAYYERSYKTIQASAWPVTTFIHDGYVATGFEYWRSFAAAHATNPPSMVIEDHPYPGNFPPQNSSSNILAQVCAAAKRYLNYPIPVVVTEWSLYTGVKSLAFEKQFYESQLVTWAWSSGGMYWSYKLVPSQDQLAQGLDYSQYSFIYLVNQGAITNPGDVGVANTNTRSNAQKYLDSLSGNCGTPPTMWHPAGTGNYTATSVTDTNLGADAPSATASSGSSSRRVKRALY